MEESRHLLGIELLIELSLAFPRLCHVEVLVAIGLFSSRTLLIRKEEFVGLNMAFDLIEGIDYLGGASKKQTTIGVRRVPSFNTTRTIGGDVHLPR